MAIFQKDDRPFPKARASKAIPQEIAPYSQLRNPAKLFPQTSKLFFQNP
ncbi:hypothetical protein [Microcoleus anatoxicus]